MKKLISLLSVLTISGTTIPTTIAASHYQKVTKLENIKIKYNNIYVLGNSLSDTGSLTDIIGCNIHPLACGYYEGLFKLDNPYYKNRSFSNGPVAFEYLSEKLNLNLNPAWEGYVYKRIGNNYAVAGTLINQNNIYQSNFEDYLLNSLNSKYSLSNQVNSLLNQHYLQKDDLILVEGGSNDLLQIIRFNSEKTQYRMIDETIKLQKEIIEKLLNYNAKNILLTNVPNLSKTPKFLNTPNEKQMEKLVNYYNNSLKKAVKNFYNKVYYFDLNKSFDDYIKIAKIEKFNTTQATIESEILSDCFLKDTWDWLMWKNSTKTKYINNFNSNDLKNNIFLDDIHPTTWLHEKISNDMYNFLLEKELEKSNLNNLKINLDKILDKNTESHNLKAGDIYIGTDDGVYLIYGKKN